MKLSRRFRSPQPPDKLRGLCVSPIIIIGAESTSMQKLLGIIPRHQPTNTNAIFIRDITVIN
jgi:hypothetical protein